METIVIKLNPELLENPDLDLSYTVPDRIEELSDKRIIDNGYDYLEGKNNPIGIWMKTTSAEQNYPFIIDIFKKEMFLENDLSRSVEIYISKSDCAELKNCKKVYPL
ncbi:hypothetical protein SAMN02745163_02973 [Clostridium cavendishii DSM 21758]|uniref:Uncharacterized protein n=1 Tax=Clostridium cavendishii DSM 21758 TaxID=1121302 RepID=A0A1M6NPQ3_9CLOT|nr:hypothetical protein [Clostridium cavendishii]SHJ97709.1 hypothetical protein SAMN02745163_02973 [Clostridium cavendishii DSM 21758]